MRVRRIVAGGQSGADRAALDVAVALRIPYGGWCPAGGWAEDLPDPPGLLARYPLLTEAPPGPVATRTRWNVRDSDATVVLALSDGASSPGTRSTVLAAEELDRPCLVVPATSASTVSEWLGAFARPVVLNVAGPRESEDPGLYAATYRTLTTVLTGAA